MRARPRAGRRALDRLLKLYIHHFRNKLERERRQMSSRIA